MVLQLTYLQTCLILFSGTIAQELLVSCSRAYDLGVDFSILATAVIYYIRFLAYRVDTFLHLGAALVLFTSRHAGPRIGVIVHRYVQCVAIAPPLGRGLAWLVGLRVVLLVLLQVSAHFVRHIVNMNLNCLLWYLLLTLRVLIVLLVGIRTHACIQFPVFIVPGI